MHAAVKRLNSKVEYVLGRIIFIGLAAMVAISFSQVVTRWAEYPLYWSEELARYIAIWLTFLGASYALRFNALARVEALLGLLSAGQKRWLAIFISLIVIAFALFLCVYGYRISLRVVRQTSPAMFIPMTLVYASAPLGGLLMLLFGTEQLLDAVSPLRQEK